MTTLAQRIFEIDDIKREKTTIPAWNDIEIEVRSITALEKSQATTQAVIDPSAGTIDVGKMYALCIIAGCYDPETNEPIFGEGDEIAILSKSNEVIEMLANKVMGSSGMKPKAVEKAQDRFSS